MKTILLFFTIICSFISSPQQGSTVFTRRPAVTVYVTNEASGDLSVIERCKQRSDRDRAAGQTSEGRSRHARPQKYSGRLSGSPIAPPGVDEDTLPPPDKKADGIRIVDADRNAVLKLMPVGSDPEEFVLSLDGGKLYIANEDVGLASVVDARAVRSSRPCRSATNRKAWRSAPTESDLCNFGR